MDALKNTIYMWFNDDFLPVNNYNEVDIFGKITFNAY